MDNVPVHVNHGAAAGEPSGRRGKNRRIRKRVVIISAGVIIAVAVIVLAILTIYRSSVGSLINTSEYQAVFFTNGQVYFGKLQSLNGNYMKLTDIFYLQTSTDPTNPQQTSTDPSANVQLIKLGSEIHGPDDEMVINRDQVLFFENLKPDGKVSQSIATYQKK
jgi:hypothetical protein